MTDRVAASGTRQVEMSVAPALRAIGSELHVQAEIGVPSHEGRFGLHAYGQYQSLRAMMPIEVG
jgi:hypothetical protein